MTPKVPAPMCRTASWIDRAGTAGLACFGRNRIEMAIFLNKERRVVVCRAVPSGLRRGRSKSREFELRPSEWSIDYDGLDQGREDECQPRSASPSRSSIIGKLREVEIVLRQGRPPRVCRRIAVSEQTYYR